MTLRNDCTTIRLPLSKVVPIIFNIDSCSGGGSHADGDLVVQNADTRNMSESDEPEENPFFAIKCVVPIRIYHCGSSFVQRIECIPPKEFLIHRFLIIMVFLLFCAKKIYLG